MTAEFAETLVNVTCTDPFQPYNHRPHGRKRMHNSRSKGETHRVVNMSRKLIEETTGRNDLDRVSCGKACFLEKIASLIPFPSTSHTANNLCLSPRAYLELMHIEGYARISYLISSLPRNVNRTFIRSEGQSLPGTAAGKQLDIFNSFLDLQKKAGPPFSHSRVITGLGSRRGSTGLSSSWDRKPAQPPAIVVGKWVWRTSASRTPHHVRSLRYSEVLSIYILLALSLRTQNLYLVICSFLIASGNRLPVSERFSNIIKRLRYLEKERERERDSCHCRSRRKILINRVKRDCLGKHHRSRDRARSLVREAHLRRTCEWQMVFTIYRDAYSSI